MFTLTTQHLRQLLDANAFPAPSADATFVLFGLRGCVPVSPDDHRFAGSQRLFATDPNYVNPRCTVVQWRPGRDDLAVFPGSTVPHRSYVKEAVKAGGEGANQLMTGYYADYRKGVHKPDSPTAHNAFRQTEGRPIRRTSDDLDFDEEDPAEVQNPCDNLHAGWCMGLNHDYYASAGCQVVVGYPACTQRGNQPDAGPWAQFKANAYAPEVKQQSFPYALLTGLDAQRVALGGAQASRRLRFGSKGPLVTRLQEALQRERFYEGRLDEDFGPRTLRAVLAFQTARFGPLGGDGVVGPVTASALGVEL